jgi:hypothetical protein
VCVPSSGCCADIPLAATAQTAVCAPINGYCVWLLRTPLCCAALSMTHLVSSHGWLIALADVGNNVLRTRQKDRLLLPSNTTTSSEVQSTCNATVAVISQAGLHIGGFSGLAVINCIQYTMSPYSSTRPSTERSNVQASLIALAA